MEQSLGVAGFIGLCFLIGCALGWLAAEIVDRVGRYRRRRR